MLTIITYHYVRDLVTSRYPQIKAVSVEGFRLQVEHVRKQHYPVTVEMILAALQSGEVLPPRAALLTFDDGYLDHYINVLPLLHEARIQGVFFPPVASARDRELLDVNRIQFILAACGSVTRIVEAINREIRELARMPGMVTPEEYWNEWAKPSRFDPAEVIYVKRMLQVALPEDVRRKIAKKLFAEVVSVDEAAFAEELYMNVGHLKMLLRCGMHVGGHGDRHQWLDDLDPSQQAREIDGCVAFLKELGVDTKAWVMSYPFGGWNASLLEILRARGCAIGLTTKPEHADLKEHDRLLLPRLDTNDLQRELRP